MSAESAVQVADWRARVFELYARVRELPPEEGHDLWRRTRDDLFATHPSTPLLPEDRPGFSGLPVAPYDPAWRFELPILPADDERMEVETGTDGIVPFERVGRVEVPDVGSLDVWRLASYGGGLFVPVKDAGAGKPGGTYGGGRYLIDTVKGAHLGADAAAKTITVDFNFAYNPSCAYDPEWACPLAPRGNSVAAAIPVGEGYSSPTH
jgi:uncharacterized protein (DUF1684 family)